VLKPGGHILAFSAARTYHHLAITLEQAGFEIRDQIMWIYSSGFPKSQDIGKQIQKKLGVKETKKATGPKSTTPRKNNYKNTLAEAQGNNRIVSDDYDAVDIIVPTDPEAQAWSGWGTALKPAHEPIALARKPIKLSIARNCQQWGVGALNIDATRIEFEDEQTKKAYIKQRIANANQPPNPNKTCLGSFANKVEKKPKYPTGGFSRLGFSEKPVEKYSEQNEGTIEPNALGRFPSNVIGEIPDYQKYFYCPKVSRKERHVGFDLTEIPTNPEGIWDVDGTGVQYNAQKNKANGNNHPTVKPIELMKYLIKLITPPGGTVLDPFNGSGSTGCAAVELGHTYIGCELDPAYVKIAETRIEAWLDHTQPKPNLKVQELFD